MKATFTKIENAPSFAAWVRQDRRVWVRFYEGYPEMGIARGYRVYANLHQPRPEQSPWAVDNRIVAGKIERITSLREAKKIASAVAV
jgi:hypothetical protein